MLPNIDLDTHMISRVNILIGYINILGEEIQITYNEKKINLITLDSCFKTKSTNFSVLDSIQNPEN